MPTPTLRARPGMSMMELLLILSVTVVVALPVAGLMSRGLQARELNQLDLSAQQIVSTVLATFSRDVRAASAISDSAADRFTLRHALSPSGVEYISYRLTAGQLQRGVAATATGAPAWADVLDAQQFKVASGAFSYYTWSNGTGTNVKQFRRLALDKFQVASVKTGDKIALPVISAMMRESDTAQSLILVSARCGCCHGANDPAGDTLADHVRAGRDCDRTDEISEHGVHGTRDDDRCDADDDVQSESPRKYALRNLSSQPVQVSAFGGAWSPTSASNYIFQLSLGKTKWGTDKFDSGDAPVALPATVTVPANGQVDVMLKLKREGEASRLTLLFYAPTDTARRDPYVVPVPLPD